MCVCVVSLRCLCTLFVKVSIVGEFMMCAGSLFQSRMVRGKNECMYMTGISGNFCCGNF